MRYILFIILIPFISLSQNTRNVFIETGISVFKPFVKEERIITNMDYQNNSNLKYSYKTTPGFYIKCGIEMLPQTEKKFNITVPINIAYKEFYQKISKEGYSYGCFSSFNGIEQNQISSKSISMMIGPKFNFNTKKIIVFTALNFNTDLFFLYNVTTEYKSTDANSYKNYTSSKPKFNDLIFSASLQLGFDYKISNRWAIGLSSDCYFLNLNPIISGDKQNNKLFNIGYGKQSLFICSGIRGNYKF